MQLAPLRIGQRENCGYNGVTFAEVRGGTGSIT
jgi:hypothetical protein